MSCALGLSCFQGVCHRMCGSPGAPCAGSPAATCESVFGVADECMFDCALDDPTACAFDAGPPAGDAGAQTTRGCVFLFSLQVTDCEMVTTADPCTEPTTTCVPGEVCQGPAPYTCMKWCTQTDGVCPGHCVTDGSKGSAPILVNGVVYGFCY